MWTLYVEMNVKHRIIGGRRTYHRVVECSTCKFFEPNTQLCQLNKLHWKDNRVNEQHCGLNGRLHVPHNNDQIRLKFQTVGVNAFLFGWTMLPVAYYVDVRFIFLWFPAIFISNVCLEEYQNMDNKEKTKISEQSVK